MLSRNEPRSFKGPRGLVDTLQVAFTIDASVHAVGERGRLPSRWRRLGGALVDGMVLLTAQWAVYFLACLATGRALVIGEPGLVLLWTGIIAAYHIIPVAQCGQTPGKVVAGTRIVSSATGAIPSSGAATVRHFAIDGPTLALSVVIFAGASEGLAAFMGGFYTLAVFGWMFVDEQRRTLADLMAGTVVVHARERGGH